MTAGEIERQIAVALQRLEEIGALLEEDDAEGALARAAELQAQIAGADDPYLVSCEMRALVFQGDALDELDRDDEALAMYDAALALGAGSDDEDIRWERLGALYDKANLLHRMGRPEACQEPLEALTTDYYAAPLESRRDTIISAEMLLAGIVADTRKVPGLAAEAYDWIIGQYGELPDDHARNAVMRARVSKAWVLCGGDNVAAEAIYREVLAEIAAAPAGAFPVAHANALFGSGWVAEQDGRTEEAVSLYRTVVATFAPGEGSSIDSCITAAREKLAAA